jgi:peptidoglycan/LPS O-acetylase OafA/YrhL
MVSLSGFGRAMRGKIGYIEGMRGIAALMVCASHFLQIFLPRVYEGTAVKSWGVGESAFETSPVNVVLNPNFAVCLFFVLSGYVLSHGFMQDGDLMRLRKTAFKRYPRLMLPVLASVLLAWAVLTAGGFHYGELRPLSSAIMPDYFASSRSFLYAVEEGSFGAFFAGNNSLNPVLWTISVELYGSFLVFGLLALFRRSRYRWFGYAAAVMLFYDSYYLAFPIGVAIAGLPERPAGRTLFAVSLALFGLALGAYPYYGAQEGFWRWLPKPGAALPIVFYHIVGAGLLLQAVILNRARTIFERPTLRFLGRISYSLYLIHFTLLASLPTWLVLRLEPNIGYLPAITFAFVATVPVLLVCAYGYAYAIDEPATRLADRCATWILALLAAIVERGRQIKLAD